MHHHQVIVRAEFALALLLGLTTIGIALALSRAKVLDVAWSVLAIVSAAVWAGYDKPVEGHTVLRVTPEHGLTTGDLTAWPAVVLAAGLTGRYLLLRRVRSRRRRSGPEVSLPRGGDPGVETVGAQSEVTTAPAATTQPTPMVTPCSTITPVPSHAPAPTVMGWARHSPARLSELPISWLSVANEHLAATLAPSSMTTAAWFSNKQSGPTYASRPT